MRIFLFNLFILLTHHIDFRDCVETRDGEIHSDEQWITFEIRSIINSPNISCCVMRKKGRENRQPIFPLFKLLAMEIRVKRKRNSLKPPNPLIISANYFPLVARSIKSADCDRASLNGVETSLKASAEREREKKRKKIIAGGEFYFRL